MLRSAVAADEAVIQPVDALRTRRQPPRRPARTGSSVVPERFVDRTPEKGAVEGVDW